MFFPPPPNTVQSTTIHKTLTRTRTHPRTHHIRPASQLEIARLREELNAKTDAGGSNHQETVDGIEMLEKHLIKLSERLRVKNQEVETLQAVIHRECVERGRLMDELTTLKSRR